MEKINKNNYPVWITDYHDGTLTGDRLEELFAFLSDHPDLMEEFEQYDNDSLHPDLSVRSLRKGLIRGFGDLTLAQQEELTAALAEGDIIGEEAEEVMSHIETSPHLADLYRSLEAIRLIPANISFPDKRSLKRYPLVPRFKKTVVTFMTAAASIAILFTLSVILNRDKPLSVPFTGLAQIDPVIITEKDRGNSQTTAENLNENPREALQSENTDEGKSLSVANSTAGNGIRTGSDSEEGNKSAATEGNDTGVSSIADKSNRIAVNAGTDTGRSGSADEGNRSAVNAGIRSYDINTGTSKEKVIAGNMITGTADGSETIIESGTRINPEQIRGGFNLALIKDLATPRIKDGAHAPVQLAEMTHMEITEENNPDSPREFIAKNFRELLLNDKNATAERLKPIELADATVTGINKLLGWEMKLEKKSDDNGTLSSISFASNLVSFNHNIKNSGN